MIIIAPGLEIDETEIQLDFIHASGPGGQNVNKVATSVQLKFDAFSSPALDPGIKQRLARLAGKRMTEAGILIITAKRYRSQERNRLDAMDRLVALIQKAIEPPKTRKATHPGARARAARLSGKKKRGEIKKNRRLTPEDWE